METVLSIAACVAVLFSIRFSASWVHRKAQNPEAGRAVLFLEAFRKAMCYEE